MCDLFVLYPLCSNKLYYYCYISFFLSGKFACKICIQGFSFAFPVNLTIPASICLLIAGCGLRTEDVCAFDHVMPGYLFWECKNGDILTDFLKNDASICSLTADKYGQKKRQGDPVVFISLFGFPDKIPPKKKKKSFSFVFL